MSTNAHLPVAANADYPPAIAAGLLGQTRKTPVRVATAAALPAYTRSGNVITANSNGSINNTGIDGLTDLAVNQRVLLKDGAAGADNGIYDFVAVGGSSAKWQMVRSADAADSSQVISGLSVFVSEGSTNGGVTYNITTADPITLNTTSITFAAAVATNPLQVSGVSIPASPSAGQSLLATGASAAVWTSQVGNRRTARNLVVSNVANLASYAVASSSANDNVSGGNVQGDRVLLVAQSTAAQNGIYQVGTVTGGNAPLTRVADLPAGMVGNQGMEVFIQESGSVFANTVWYATRSGGFTVGTNDPAFYPRKYTRVTTAMSGTPGTKTLSAEWILSATLSSVTPVAKAPGTQGFLSVGTLSAGAGSGSVTITSTANETSTLQVTIEN